MMTSDPSMRIDMGDILMSKWMQGPVATHEEALAEMVRRKQVTEQLQDQKRNTARSGNAGDRRAFDLNGVQYLVEYENESQVDDDKYQLLAVKELNTKSRGVMLQAYDQDTTEVFSKISEFLFTKHGVKEDQIKIQDGEWKL